jgi:hypothetical protein
MSAGATTYSRTITHDRDDVSALFSAAFGAVEESAWTTAVMGHATDSHTISLTGHVRLVIGGQHLLESPQIILSDQHGGHRHRG